MTSSIVIDKKMLDDNPFVKELIGQYFQIEHDEIMHRLHIHDKYLEAKRINAYKYFIKSKTDPEIKIKIDERRKAWYERNKDIVQQKQRERLNDDPDYKEK
jgi:hypothetical protein